MELDGWVALEASVLVQTLGILATRKLV